MNLAPILGLITRGQFQKKHYHALISGAHLGIDQHARQLTILLRDESGDVLQARQVSTRPEKLQTSTQPTESDENAA